MQFAGWLDSSKAGPRVTFRLAGSDELRPFIGLEGRRFMAVFVEIGAGEEPAHGTVAPATEEAENRRMRATLDAMSTAKGPLGPMAMWCVIRCKDPVFQRWAGAQDEAGAKARVLEMCDVTSRRDLDDGAEATQRFHQRVRRPFVDYLAGEPE